MQNRDYQGQNSLKNFGYKKTCGIGMGRIGGKNYWGHRRLAKEDVIEIAGDFKMKR